MPAGSIGGSSLCQSGKKQEELKVLRQENQTLSRCVLTLRAEKGYWQSLHAKASLREENLKVELETANARIKQLEQQLFGKKTERHSTSIEKRHSLDGELEKRKRGHQPDTPGHGQRTYEHLPVIIEEYILNEDHQCCQQCGLPYAELSVLLMIPKLLR